MWKLLSILAILANFILLVKSARGTQTIITVQNKVNANTSAEIDGGNGTANAGAGASSSGVTIIKTDQKLKKCAAHEKYVKCPEKLCEPQVCEDVGFPQCSPLVEKNSRGSEDTMNQSTTTEKPCTGACVCKEDYVRNHDGICIPVKNCPSCGADKNATAGCGINCGRRCFNYDSGPVTCTEECYENSCDCRKGYVFDDYRGFCVLPKDCSNKDAPDSAITKKPGKGTTEGEDEAEETDHTYSVYESTTTDYETETEMETTRGDCGIHIDMKTTTTKGPNDCKGRYEWYFDCAPACPQQTCDDYLNGVKCPKNTKLQHCKPECRCQNKYYKDEEGNCVTPRECRKRAKSVSTTANPVRKDKTTKSSATMMSTIPEPDCVDDLMEPFIIGNLGYTIKLLTALSQRDPDNNVIVGGASILYLFAQLVVKAKGKVMTEILETINFNNTEKVTCFFSNVSAEINAEYFDIQYDLFCKIYADINNALSSEYIESTKDKFLIGPENYDFSSRESAQKINSEVANYTNDSFLKFVKPNILSPLDGLVFVDAEHFQGIWEKQFNPTDTVVKDFYTKRRTVKLPTMYSKGKFLYADSSRLSAKILILKYSGGRHSLAIILPHSSDGTRDLLRKLENSKTTQSALDSVKYENVEVYLPKFNISVATRLRKPALTASIKKAFDNTTTDLEKIGSAKPPYVREILQKITFQVNELGMGDTMEPDFAEDIHNESKMVTKYQFKADHPFLFALMFDKIVLQAGQFIR